MMDEDVTLLRGLYHLLIMHLDKAFLSFKENNEEADSSSTIIKGFQMKTQL